MIKLGMLIYNHPLINMKNRGKENNQNNNNQFIASTYRVESDQKDILIRNLKGDHEHYKKSEGEYYRLQEHYKQLQNKHRALADEVVFKLLDSLMTRKISR